MNFSEIITISLTLFAVIDILGSVPIIIDLRTKMGHIQSEKATLVSGGIMIAFLFLGEKILKLIHLDIPSFAIAGAIVMFFLALEMILNIEIFKEDGESRTGEIVPIAFPLIAGSGTLTTLISLRAEFDMINIIFGVLINLAFVYLVLKTTKKLERLLGKGGIDVMRRIFGIILMAIAVKLFLGNLKIVIAG
ncbi:MAG: MarC family protein [Flavobacteriales bacterium]|jgi:multiple antibiotic resistance protein|nr:MarC family protein [Flavobacteriales bacterium]